jgi:hypothetical protein
MASSFLNTVRDPIWSFSRHLRSQSAHQTAITFNFKVIQILRANAPFFQGIHSMVRQFSAHPKLPT